MSESAMKRIAGEVRQLNPLIAHPNIDESRLLKAARAALKLHPTSEFAWFGLASIYGDIDCRFYSPKKAAHAYRKVLKINPANSYAWANLALACADSRQYKKAIAAGKEAVRIDPGNLYAASNLRIDSLGRFPD